MKLVDFIDGMNARLLREMSIPENLLNQQTVDVSYGIDYSDWCKSMSAAWKECNRARKNTISHSTKQQDR